MQSKDIPHHTPASPSPWWLRLASIPDEPADPVEALRSQMLMLTLVMVAGCLFALIVIELIWGRSDAWIAVCGMLMLLMAGAFDYVRSSRHRIYSHLLVGGLVGLLFALICLTGGTSRASLITFPSIVALAATLMPVRAVLIWAAVMLAGPALSLYLRAVGAKVYIPLNPQWLETSIDRMTLVLIAMTAMIGIICSVLIARMFQRFAIADANIKENEQRVERAEQRLEQFVEMGGAWFWETDDQHRLVYLSKGFERSTGVPIKTALGLTPAQVTQTRYADSPVAETAMRPLLERRAFRNQMLSWSEPLTGMISRYENSGSPLFDANGLFRGFRGRMINVSDRNENVRQARESIHGDFLTGLMSRRGMLEALDRTLIQVRDSEQVGWWIYIDLDEFHVINDRLNYAQGDVYLRRFAHSLLELGNGRESLSRLGGDEFGMLLVGATRIEVEEMTTNVLGISRGLRMEFLGAAAAGSASLGVVRLSTASASVSAVLKAADEACKRAQNAGGARVVFAE